MRSYKTLFEVEVLHNYYKSGYSEDFEIYPVDDCMRYLVNNKMIFRKTNTGFKIAYMAIDDSGTPLITLGDYKFRFICLLKNTREFYYRTKLVFGSTSLGSGNVVCFSNKTVTSETFSSSIIHLVRPNEFTFIFPFLATDKSSDTASLEILDFDNTSNIIDSFSAIKPDTFGYYNQKIELPAVNNTRYIFRVSDSNHSSEDIVVQINNTLYRRNFFGLIEISYEEDTLAKYKLSLSRKESYWKFFIVNKNNLIDFTSEQLEINDITSSVEAPYSINNFTNTVQPDTDISINGFETAVFTSEDPIPCYESPKLNLQLKRVAGAPHPHDIELITHLPNPGISGKVNEDNESEIYVFI